MHMKHKPVRIYSEVGPIEFNKTYYQESVFKIAAQTMIILYSLLSVEVNSNLCKCA